MEVEINRLSVNNWDVADVLRWNAGEWDDTPVEVYMPVTHKGMSDSEWQALSAKDPELADNEAYIIHDGCRYSLVEVT